MPKPIDVDYNAVWLFPPSLEDLVPRDHPARFIREFVDALDLVALGFKDQPCEEGRPPYAKSLLLKVWLYGYGQGIFSSRKLEKACGEHLSLLWLTGLRQIDHNTLWRFWRDNRAAIRQVFRQTMAVAAEAGLIGWLLQAVDGTKIEAAASGYSGWSKEYMNKLLAQLEGVLEQGEEQVEQNQKQEQGEYRLPESLAERKALKAAIEKGLKDLEQSGQEHYHPHEPEARRMLCSGRNRYAYNAQAVRDESGIITAAEVTDQANDVGQLVPMIEQSQQNTGHKTALTVADTGYGTGNDMAKAQQAGFEVIAPPPIDKQAQDKPYHTNHFKYEAQRDVCVCPQGKELSFERIKPRRQIEVRVYRCRQLDCPVRHLCTRDRAGRTIEIAPFHEVVLAQRRKLEEEQARQKLRRRSVIIEPLFGWIKQHLGFRRWTMWGKEAARAQWALLCTVINLRVLKRSWEIGKLKFKAAG